MVSTLRDLEALTRQERASLAELKQTSREPLRRDHRFTSAIPHRARPRGGVHSTAGPSTRTLLRSNTVISAISAFFLAAILAEARGHYQAATIGQLRLRLPSIEEVCAQVADLDARLVQDPKAGREQLRRWLKDGSTSPACSTSTISRPTSQYARTIAVLTLRATCPSLARGSAHRACRARHQHALSSSSASSSP